MEGQRASNRGFTLIELLIVVAVIGVLAAVAIPVFSGYRIKAYNSAAITGLKSAKTVLECYWYENRQYP